jgi:hypothetical protein
VKRFRRDALHEAPFVVAVQVLVVVVVVHRKRPLADADGGH